MPLSRRSALLGCACLALSAMPARAAQPLRVASQRTGTLAWELDVVRRHGLDRRHGVSFSTVDLANPEAAKIAIAGGAADLFLTDWLWTSRERSLGTPMRFAPYSTAAGGLYVPAGSSIRTVEDLRGRTLSVAGGALSHNWVFLQAVARRRGLDLKRDAAIVFGAPPLLLEGALQGRADATLTFWNFGARLEAAGFRPLLAIDDLTRELGARGAVSVLGYVWNETLERERGAEVAGLLKACRDAKRILLESDAEWDAIRSLTQAPDDAVFQTYRRRFREGVPRRPAADEEADARVLYGVLAEAGGADLVGHGAALAPGTFGLALAQPLAD